MAVLHTISKFFLSCGIDPLIGGFIAGILVCAFVRVGVSVGRTAGGSTFSGGDIDRPSLSIGREQTFGSSQKIRMKVNGMDRELGSAESSEVICAVRRGNKIEAIKLVRELMGIGLMDAHTLVEVIETSQIQ